MGGQASHAKADPGIRATCPVRIPFFRSQNSLKFREVEKRSFQSLHTLFKMGAQNTMSELALDTLSNLPYIVLVATKAHVMLKGHAAFTWICGNIEPM